MSQMHVISAFAIGCAASLVHPNAAMASRPCPPDTNCSGAVDIDDLVTVITSWGATGGPADVNQSGAVDIDDLVQVITRWGPCLFNFGPSYPNAEAHQIGLEMLGPTGPLALSQSLYERIDRDLGLIRGIAPGLVGQIQSPAWVNNHLIVSVPNVQSVDYLCLNKYYQVISIQPLFGAWYVLTFAGPINVAALAHVYVSSGAVSFAEPDGLIGGENFFTIEAPPNGNWQWDIDDGFWDCFDGCDCHRYYRFYTYPDGTVQLVGYTEAGQPWCVFSMR